MLLARLFGMAFAKIGQPRVMGEVLAGIVLGPTVVGTLWPDLETALFPSDIIPYIGDDVAREQASRPDIPTTVGPSTMPAPQPHPRLPDLRERHPDNSVL